VILNIFHTCHALLTKDSYVDHILYLWYHPSEWSYLNNVKPSWYWSVIIILCCCWLIDGSFVFRFRTWWTSMPAASSYLTKHSSLASSRQRHSLGFITWECTTPQGERADHITVVTYMWERYTNLLLLFWKKHWFSTDDWSLQQDPTFWLYVFRFHFNYIPSSFCGWFLLHANKFCICLLFVKATYLSRHLHTLTVPGTYWPAWNFLHSPHNDISQEPNIHITPLLFFGQPSKYWTKYLCYVGNCSIEVMFTCKL
jgi:hypothetical protein